MVYEVVLGELVVIGGDTHPMGRGIYTYIHHVEQVCTGTYIWTHHAYTCIQLYSLLHVPYSL